MNREELLELIPAYALGALDADELIEVDDLLAHDAEAQSLLEEYDAITAVLPFAVPQHPAPAHLRADLKARLAKPSSASSPEPVAQQTKTETGTEKKSNILPFPTNTLISVAAAILVVAIGLVAFLMNGGETDVNPNEVLFNELIEQDGSQRFDITPQLAFEANGELVYSADGSQAVLRISSLPDTTEEESYQLWLTGLDDMQESAGIFHWPDGHGPYYVLIDHPIEQLASIGMTIEPFEGSPDENLPTGERLFSVAVAQAR